MYTWSVSILNLMYTCWEGCFSSILFCQGVEHDVTLRYTVQPKPYICTFTPAQLTDEEMAANSVKHAKIGAVFANQMAKLPVSDAKVLFEVEMCLVPPGCLKPLKPKLWLMGSCRLESGKHYLLM